MARTAEQVLRDYLGDQVLVQVRMMAELEMLRDEVKAAKDDAPTITKPNGADRPKPNGRVAGDPGV